MQKQPLRIGIDLGGTKIEAIAFDREDTQLLRKRVYTPRHRYAETIDAISSLLQEVEYESQGEGTVGIGIPGAISPKTGLVKNANSTWLNGKPFQQDLEQALSRPIRLANDANCFALSEAIDGAAHAAKTVFGVILGTGVGGGIVVNKTVLTGQNAIAGEWGHTPLPRVTADEVPGPSCYCGRSGCIETWLSGPALEAQFEALTGETSSAAKIATLADAAHPVAARLMNQYIDRLGRSLSTIINILDPDCIVLGGGLSNIETLYENLPERMTPHVFSDAYTTPILRNVHGDSSGVRGAAWLWSKTEAFQT